MTEFFKGSFFPYIISEWNNLPLRICHYKLLPAFENVLLKIERPLKTSVYNFHKTFDVKLF